MKTYLPGINNETWNFNLELFSAVQFFYASSSVWKRTKSWYYTLGGGRCMCGKTSLLQYFRESFAKYSRKIKFYNKLVSIYMQDVVTMSSCSLLRGTKGKPGVSPGEPLRALWTRTRLLWSVCSFDRWRFVSGVSAQDRTQGRTQKMHYNCKKSDSLTTNTFDLH